ncbi:MAG: glycosyltransferase family 39 protein [Acidobacteria bacterium]|nr:glycosyltransferase family 39 protein [Acidobacteriota bacterium]
MPLTRERGLLWTILAVALAFRVWFLANGVPHAVGIDEPAIVDRALRILTTGDWNPHVFDYPTLTIYVHAFAAVVRFLLGAVQGQWASLAEFDISAVYRTGRALSAVIGTATVWLTYRIGLDLRSARLGLLAAAQLAVLPMHVRESHFILTDAPVTALTTMTVWLSMRAAVTHDVRSYAVAGAAAGLAAAAKYNGGVAMVAVIAAWALHEWSTDCGPGRKVLRESPLA